MANWLFWMKLDDSFRLDSYVLDGIDPTAIRDSLKELSELVKGIDLDIKLVNWAELKSAYLQIPNDASKVISVSESVNHVDPLLMLVPVEISSLPAILASEFGCSGYKHLSEFKIVVESIIEKRKDDELANLSGELFRTCKKVKAVCSGVSEYFLLFFPSADRLQSETTSRLKSILRTIIEFFKKLIKSMKQTSNLLIDLIKDPDAFYLWLRGEVHEYTLRNPGKSWAELLFFVPDLFRLYIRLMMDKRVSKAVKRELLWVLAYLLLPYDAIPEGFIGPAGYIEDVYVCARLLLRLTNENCIPLGILEEHWLGKIEELHKLMVLSNWFEDNFEFFRKVGNLVTNSRLQGHPLGDGGQSGGRV